MKKRILIVLLVLVVLFLCSVLFYTFFMYGEDVNEIYSTITIEDEKKEVETSETTDKELYNNNIIYDEVKSYDYELIMDDDSIYGTIYIDDDGYLYISDKKNIDTYQISDVKFKTLYRDEDTNGILKLYALSNEGTIYYIFLNELDITKIDINLVETDFTITNFTDIKFKSMYGINLMNIIVLAEDNNIYEARTGIRYNSNVISLNEQYYVFSDNTIANSYGNMLKDSDGNYYKIKYYIQINNNSNFENINSLIITENNELLYKEDNSNSLYVYNSLIKDINYVIGEDSYNKVDLKLTFENGTNIDILGYYTDYYGFE